MKNITKDLKTKKAALIISIINEHNFKYWHEVCSAFNGAGVNFSDEDMRFTEHYLDYISGAPRNYEWDKTINKSTK